MIVMPGVERVRGKPGDVWASCSIVSGDDITDHAYTPAVWSRFLDAVDALPHQVSIRVTELAAIGSRGEVTDQDAS